MPVDPEVERHLPRLTKLSTELSKRARQSRLLERYHEGQAPPPEAVIQARVTQAYRRLMPLSDAPWGNLIVSSVLDRLEISGIDTGEREADQRLWALWQDNHLDNESKLAHQAALMAGRAFALIWPDEDGQPEISLDGSDQMIVQYRHGSRTRRVAALRRWFEDGRQHATLYLPDGIYKFRGVHDDSGMVVHDAWERRVEKRPNGDDEPWPVPNSYGVVPVVELAVNQRLKPGEFGWARGEYAHVIGLIDRINLLTFLGLVVAFWMGFPLRGIIGDKILRDDNNDPIPPVRAMANELFQLENPNAKLDQFEAADRGNLSVFDELSQLAMLTKTPRHYMPYSGGLSNISADAIRADEGGLAAKVVDHKSGLSDGWEDVLRIAGLMLTPKIVVPPTAELSWQDHESRSMAERADAAVKLEKILPWQVLAKKYLNATDDEVRKWETLRTSDAFSQLLSAATETGGTATVTVPNPAANGAAGT